MRFILPLAASVALAVAAFVAAPPASAAPAPITSVARDGGGVEQVQYRRRSYRPRAHRQRMMRRSSPGVSSGNARNPSRPPMQQNRGNTSGGYR